jgi:hypothetical protein
MIPGSEGSKQGGYLVLNDADVTLSIAAAHATLNRIDLVAFKVEDTAYSGAVNSSSLVVVTGTPAGSPVAPTAPNNSITLATVSVVALDTSITNGEITDQRTYLPNGGILPIRNSGVRPAAGTVPPGHMNWNIGGGKYEFTPDGGTSWVDGMPLYKARTTTGGTVASVTLSSIPSNLRKIAVAWTARSDEAAKYSDIRVRINGSSAASYDMASMFQLNNVVSSGSSTGNTSWIAGVCAGGNAAAGVYGGGEIVLPGWDSPHSACLNFAGSSGSIHAAADCVVETCTGRFNVAGPYTSITLFPGSGNFVIGSDFSVVGTYA